MKDTERKALVALREAKADLRAKDWQAKTPGSARAFFASLKALSEAGYVAQTDEGLYYVTLKGRSVLDARTITITSDKFAQVAARNKAFAPRDDLLAPNLADLLALDDAAFRRKFSGSPITRIGRDRFVRNCLVAAGNSGDGSLLGPVGRLRGDPDPAVAEAAAWAHDRLTSDP